MNDSEFQAAAKDPQTRQTQYKELVTNYYERITDTYREKWSNSFHFAVFNDSEPLEEALVNTERRLTEEAKITSKMHLLDVGCGVGGPALNIARITGAKVTGINIVEKQLDIARGRAEEMGLADRVTFTSCDATQMSFPDEYFDAVYLFEAGCHMPYKRNFYEECARVLIPGGMFFGQDWFRSNDPTPEEEEEYVEPICRFFSLPDLISLRVLDDYLSDAGLDVETVRDARELGDIQRNWEMLDRAVVKAIHGWLPWLLPSTIRLLTDGGMALSKAAKAGVFQIGQWVARKPLVR